MARRKLVSIHDREPENMTTAVVAKCHCHNMIALLDGQAKEAADKKRLWKRRLRMNLKAIDKFAREK